MKPSVKSTIKYDQAQRDNGMQKIHPWVPASKVKEVLAHCKSVREEFKLDKGNGNEK